MSVYVIVDSGKVSNIIVADADFAAAIAGDHEAVVLQAGNCGIGDKYDSGLSASNPSDTIAEEGTTATLYVYGNSIDGSTVTYQWKKYGTNITSAHDSCLRIDAAVPEDYGIYSCEVSDGVHTIETDTATLTII